MPASPTTKTMRPLPAARGFEGGPERLELARAAGKRRQTFRGASIDAVTSRALSRHLEYVDGLRFARERLRAEVAHVEERRDEATGRLGDHDGSRRGERLKTRGKMGRVADGRVLDAQVVADAAEDDEAGVDADAHPEIDLHGLAELFATARRASLDRETRPCTAGAAHLRGPAARRRAP